MKKDQDPQLTPEEELRAENNLLKVKLNMDYGMPVSDTSSLPPHVENDWLKYIDAFERQFKDAKVTTVYDFVGRPSFSKWDTLTPEQTRTELERLLAILELNDVALDCLCPYDDAVIYRFVTEELFHEEIDLIRIPGMTHHFIYEEFHPNHEHDLRQNTERFIKAVFEKKWDVDHDGILLAREINWSGKRFDCAGMSKIITTFQEAHRWLRMRKSDIREVHFDADAGTAKVSGTAWVSGKAGDGEKVKYDGSFCFHFTNEYDFWSITDFEIPGLVRNK